MPPPSNCRRTHAQPLVEARLDGAQRTPLQVGNLLERQPVVLLQDDGGALLFGQRRHRLRHRPAELAPRHQRLNRLDRPLRRRQFGDVDVLGHLHHRCPPLAAHPVAAEVEGDAVEPRRELRLALEALEGPERAQERFLADVASVVFTADRPVRQGVDRPLPAANQLVEAVDVAVHRSHDEFLVGDRQALHGKRRPFPVFGADGVGRRLPRKLEPQQCVGRPGRRFGRPAAVGPSLDYRSRPVARRPRRPATIGCGRGRGSDWHRRVFDHRGGPHLPPGEPADGLPADRRRQAAGGAGRAAVAVPPPRHRRLARKPAGRGPRGSGRAAPAGGRVARPGGRSRRRRPARPPPARCAAPAGYVETAPDGPWPSTGCGGRPAT